MIPPHRRSIAFVRFLASAVAALAIASPAQAITGSRSAPGEAAARAVVTVIGSRGNVCTGAMIAPQIVLTAAHCTAPGAAIRVVDYSTTPPRLVTPRQVATHPRYSAQAMAAHRATADVALLLLPSPVPGKAPVPLGMPRLPIVPGAMFTVVGIGVTSSAGDDVGTARAAGLTVTGQPGTLQIRLADPRTQNRAAGQGACTGDSGAPAFEDQNGRGVIVGVVSWSTGPNNSAGCGGLTGVTPLTLYRDWIVQTARGWGAAL
jgi:hypothetical protein